MQKPIQPIDNIETAEFIIRVAPSVKKELTSLKVHPKQSYSEVISKLLREHYVHAPRRKKDS